MQRQTLFSPEGYAFVVDDFASNVAILKRLIQNILNETGSRICIDTAQSGEEALEIFQQRLSQNIRYGLIVLDKSMPGLSGIETAEKFRELEHTQNDELNLDLQETYIVSCSTDIDNTNPFAQETLEKDPINRAHLREIVCKRFNLPTKHQSLDLTPSQHA